MGNLFFSIPAPAADGSGAPVDVSALGATKTIIISGSWVLPPTTNIEISNSVVPGAGGWQSVLTVQGAGGAIVPVAARWMRATVARLRGFDAPIVNVGGSDVGASFAALGAPAGNGVGSPVDASTLPLFKTIQVGGPFRGVLIVEASTDGGATYGQIAAFNTPSAYSIEFTADFLRVRRGGVPQTRPGLPTVNIGACDVASGGGGGGLAAVLHNNTLTGDGTSGTPLSTVDGRTGVLVDGTTITGTGKIGSPLVAGGITAVIHNGTLSGNGTANSLLTTVDGATGVAVDGTTITGTGKTGSPLVAVGGGGGGAVTDGITIQGAGTAGSPVALKLAIQTESAVINGNWNDYLLATSASEFRLPTQSQVNFFGFVAQPGRLVTLYNVGAGNVSFFNEYGPAAATNRFALPRAADVTISPGGSASFFYDTVTARWRLYAIDGQVNSIVVDGTLQGAGTSASPLALNLTVTTENSITGGFWGDINLSSPIVRIPATNSDVTLTGWYVRSGLITIYNVGTFNINLLNEHLGTGSQNRYAFPNGGDISIVPGGSASFFYDVTTSRWRLHAIDGQAPVAITTESSVTSGGWSDYTFPAGSSDVRVPATTAAVSFSGFTARPGRRITIHNVGTFSVTIQAENSGSSAVDRFRLPGAADIVIVPDGSATFIYDSVSARWRCTAIVP